MRTGRLLCRYAAKRHISAHPHSTTTWIIRDAPGCSGSRN